MKINDILECYNKVLDINNPEKKHFVAHSTLEKKIGPVKEAVTYITLCNPTTGKNECIVKTASTDFAISDEAKDKLIEESEKKALIDFIVMRDNDTGLR